MVPEIITVDLVQLTSGDRLWLQAYRYAGRPGRKVYIQANLHGAEIVGNAIIYRLMEWLATLDCEQLQGEIWLVPHCNPLSANQRNHYFTSGRFNSYDGRDWNRIFWDYTKVCSDLEDFAQTQLALDPDTIVRNFRDRLKAAFKQELDALESPTSQDTSRHYRYRLQSLCLDADYLLDLHSSSNQGTDYLFCFESRQASAPYFLLDWGILMRECNGESFDEAFMKPWLALEKTFAKLGRNIQFDLESWTLEYGSGMQMQPESIALGLGGIKNYLAAQEVVKLDSSIAQRAIKLIAKDQLQRYYAPRGGTILKRVSLKTQVKMGQLLYELLSFSKGQPPSILPIYAEATGFVCDLSTNQAVNQGEYVLALMKE